MPLFPHQTVMVDMLADAFENDYRLVFLTPPTASGKSHVLYPVFKRIKEIDENIKFIISAPQIELVEAIYNKFQAGASEETTGQRPTVILIRGTEKQVMMVVKDQARLESAVNHCLERIAASHNGPSKKKKDLDEEKAEFSRHIMSAANDARTITSIYENSVYDTESMKAAKEDLLKKQQSSLHAHYVSAEKILNRALRTIAQDNAALKCKDMKGTEEDLKKAKKKKAEDEYLKQIKNLSEDVVWLFPDMHYELADVVILTHAKLHRSILTKRRMVLSEISYKKEGKHIALFMDEAEVARDSYIDMVIQQAVIAETDLLPLLNRIHNVLAENFFDNPEYKHTEEGAYPSGTKHVVPLTFDASVPAKALKEKFDRFKEKYGYTPNMHMADLAPDKTSVPKLVNCRDYNIAKDAKYCYIKAEADEQAVYLVDKEKENMGMSSFVADARSIIRNFISCCRTATWALNHNRAKMGKIEEAHDTASSVAYRLFGDKDSAMSRYIIDNIRLRYRGKSDPDKEWTTYRSDTSYTRVKPGTSYGGDVSLRHATVPQFPEANMEDILSNIRFTCLISGTGWLAASNNYNMEYLKTKQRTYIPDKEKTQELHDKYMEWKEEQYKKAGTKFVFERLSDSGTQREYQKKDLEIISVFIKNHIELLGKHGVHGSTGAFIFPPRKLDHSGTDLIAMLRKQGVDTKKVALMTLQKGGIKELSENGEFETVKGSAVYKDGDTIVVNTEDGRYYYVITAHRSGTRGYNVAFANGVGEYCDASGLCLHDLTNIIPSKEKPEKGKEYDLVIEDRKDTDRILRTNMAYAHHMMLRDGKISPDLMQHARWLIQMISFTSSHLSKDIYREDPWSPYKLQGTSEILQALGRVRNNRKPPLIYIGLSTEIFAKQMLREETLRPECLSYEAVKLYEQLPRLWQEYEAEASASEEFLLLEEEKEKKRFKNQTDVLKTRLPKAKKEAAKDPSRIKELELIVGDYEAAKKQAITLGSRFSTDYKGQKILTDGLWLQGRTNVEGKKKARVQNLISPFIYTSYWSEKEKKTIYHMKQQRGRTYMTPSSMCLTETAEIFSSFCGKQMADNMPEIMDKNMLRALKEKDRFPYAPSKYCMDVLRGEYGERLFLSMMQEAKEQSMTALTVLPMPLLQYEDFDFMLETGNGVAGYVNVKYRKTSFEPEKDPKLYVEKLMRSPLHGTIRLLYINMLPEGKNIEVYLGDNNPLVMEVNKELEKYGKKMEIFLISPFAEYDMYGHPDILVRVIGDTIKKLNAFFI